MTIGRSNSCDIIIPDDKTIGREHCRILFRNEEYYIRDNHSSNGTFLNGEPVLKDQQIRNGDLLKIGRKLFFIHFLDRAPDNE